MHPELSQTIALLTASLRNGVEAVHAAEAVRARAGAASAIDRFAGTQDGKPVFVNDQKNLTQQADTLTIQGVMALIDAVSHAGSLPARVLPLVRQHKALLERAGITLSGIGEDEPKKEIGLAV